MTTLTDAEACVVLKRLFEARGYTIQENVAFREGEVAFHIDGWDAAQRVGYEFISSAAGDHDDLSPEAMATLAEWMGEGKLAIYLIDQADVRGEPELVYSATRFLDDLAGRQHGGA